MPVSYLPRRAGKPTGARLDVIVRLLRERVRVRLVLWCGMSGTIAVSFR